MLETLLPHADTISAIGCHQRPYSCGIRVYLGRCAASYQLVNKMAQTALAVSKKKGFVRRPISPQRGIRTCIVRRTFRATGITIYLTNGGDLEKAQQMAAHESPQTTKLYDLRS